MYQRVFTDPREPRTVVVVPSLTLPETELEKIIGVIHYEERLLCLLMLLRLPRTQLIYVTSKPLDPAIIDYYLHLLPGVPGMHARNRLHLVSVDDGSTVPLSRKILQRPELLESLRAAIRYPESAHLTCFNSTNLERSLAIALGIPMYAADPNLVHLGNKSMGRALFRELGLDLPAGYEHLTEGADVRRAVFDLHRANPELQRAVIKLNEGFSGEGNAVLDLRGLGDVASTEQEIERRLNIDLRFEAANETWDSFESKLSAMGGVVEAMVEHHQVRSPSVQMRIDPLGNVHIVSTHDQVLGGPNGQVFEGCRFPAHRDYRVDLHDAGLAVGRALRDRGVIGRFAIDFISVREGDRWRHYAIEINLRKGGTTLPYLMLEFLTDGTYDPEHGVFRTPTGSVRTYFATDNLIDDVYRGLTPEELIDLTVLEGLHYHATEQKGLVYHLLGAVTDFGKIGMVSIAESREASHRQYARSVKALSRASANLHG
jgi:hypothetical protein